MKGLKRTDVVNLSSMLKQMDLNSREASPHPSQDHSNQQQTRSFNSSMRRPLDPTSQKSLSVTQNFQCQAADLRNTQTRQQTTAKLQQLAVKPQDRFGSIVIKLDDIFQDSLGSIPAQGSKQNVYEDKSARPSVQAKFDRTKRQSMQSMSYLYNTPCTKKAKKSILYLNRHESTGLTPNQGHFYEVVKPATMRKTPTKMLMTAKVQKPNSKKS